MVAERFDDHFGNLEGFHYAVTQDQAKAALLFFINQRLPQFGDYQDAMIEGEAWMFHAHIGLYLNCGLLLPMDCIEAAEKAIIWAKHLECGGRVYLPDPWMARVCEGYLLA